MRGAGALGDSLDGIRLEEPALLCLGAIKEAKIKVIFGKMSGMVSLSWLIGQLL